MTRSITVSRTLCIAAVFVVAMLNSASAQEKRSTSTRRTGSAPAAKQSASATARQDGNGALPDRAKPAGGERKSSNDSARTRDQADDYWTTCYGGFHMSGNGGHAVYRFPPSPTGNPYDTNWTFTDDLPVGSRQGWTYKEDGYQFYMFFASTPDSNGKFWVGYSDDNTYFDPYAWAD
jgi:hypothetical protein